MWFSVALRVIDLGKLVTWFSVSSCFLLLSNFSWFLDHCFCCWTPVFYQFHHHCLSTFPLYTLLMRSALFYLYTFAIHLNNIWSRWMDSSCTLEIPQIDIRDLEIFWGGSWKCTLQGIRLRSYSRAVFALNHWEISLPHIPFFYCFVFLQQYFYV